MATSRQKSLFGDEVSSLEPMPWEVAAERDRLVAQVVVNRPLRTPFDYLVPEPLRESLQPGARVRVPFGKGNRLTTGYCVGLKPFGSTAKRLKEIHSVLDPEPLLSARMLKLTHWMAERYLCGWGQVLESVVPAGVKKRAGTRLQTVFRLVSHPNCSGARSKLTPKQQAVLDVLCATNHALSASELCQEVGCGPGPIQALRKKGLIEAIQQRTDRFEADVGTIERVADLTLNDVQQAALDAILNSLCDGVYNTFLLHGVTGSGKTEVYIRAIQEVVSYGREAIVLVPEISLTPQTIRRFRSRFDSVAVLHSHLSDSERRWHWQRIARGEVQVVVGARSAVFAPVPHLGLIVIDEEHETTFKQETTPRYQTRDVARYRAQMDKAPLILGSATPTLESWRRAEQGIDVLLSLPHRVEQRPLPPVHLVDTRNDPHCLHGAAIGRAMYTAMRQALADHGQVILFLNLRGYSPSVWCRGCGTGVPCPRCDITLTWHRDRNAVVCHFCGFQTGPLKQCPQCGHAGLLYLGTGTQKLEKEVRAKFPEHRCLRMDSDSMRRPGSHDVAIEAFRSGDVQILLGTQMIAKGLDFPNVTLVGVIDADTMLHQPDLRASERTFQLIAQVAGRTGRSARGGRVLVQTAAPTEPAIVKAAQHDYLGFAALELKNRRETAAPPYRRLARVILRGPKEPDVKQAAETMTDIVRRTIQTTEVAVDVLGPAPAPIIRQKMNFRYHFLLRAEQYETIHELWNSVEGQLPPIRGVEFIIDVDPINMR